jgi:hypothetical protein
MGKYDNFIARLQHCVSGIQSIFHRKALVEQPFLVITWPTGHFLKKLFSL